ncbi:MAG: DNA polymerase/3'-5' exonuclease PolX [Anaerolineales bacterium]
MTNHQLSQIFTRIANLLEIKGENTFKILAYRKAAETLQTLPREAANIYHEGGVPALKAIPGIGQAIAEKIEELLQTGKLRFWDNLSAEIPPSLLDMLPIPDLGPKKIARFWRELGIVSVPQLQAAAQAGQLRGLSGMGEKSEAKILAGIEALQRRSGRIPLGQARPFALEQTAFLRTLAGVQRAEVAGSVRRWRETIGDIDLVAAAEDSAPVLAAFIGQRGIVSVRGQGTTKASVEFDNGLRAQLWVHPPARFGTALQYATGSQAHNVALREHALKCGFSLSEHALTRLDTGEEVLCATEEDVYGGLGLPWIPPEVREAHGELAVPVGTRWESLLTTADIRAALHNHSQWSDGDASIEEMALAAIARGYKVLAITDHSHSLGIVQGVRPENLPRQRAEIAAVQQKLGNQILLLHGAEVEIRADGSLDYADEVLAQLDVVVASLHTSLRQPKAEITTRLLRAIRNPHVDIIGHPSGRLLPDREGADLDWDAVLAAAVECNTALEINANPHRLDLSDVYARRAAEMGIKLSINTDAHAPEQFDLLPYGVAVARRAWLTAGQVLNTLTDEALLAWLQRRA